MICFLVVSATGKYKAEKRDTEKAKFGSRHEMKQDMQCCRQEIRNEKGMIKKKQGG